MALRGDSWVREAQSVLETWTVVALDPVRVSEPAERQRGRSREAGAVHTRASSSSYPFCAADSLTLTDSVSGHGHCARWKQKQQPLAQEQACFFTPEGYESDAASCETLRCSARGLMLAVGLRRA